MSDLTTPDRLATPAENNRMLLEVSRQLDDATAELRKCLTRHAEAKRDLALAESLVYAQAKAETATEAGRARIVKGRTAEEAFAVDMADALVKSAKADYEVLLAKLSAFQTVASTIKTEMQMAGRFE